MVAEPFSVDAAVVAYRLFVIAYAATIPGYFYYRWAHTVQWDAEWTCAYQVLTCALEMYGALNVLLLGLIRFRCPWAPACPKPPELTSAGVGHWREDEPLAATPEGAARWAGPYTVNILIPCCSEPDDVIFGTVRAALALRHPLASAVKVFLLDDGAQPARRAELARCAEPCRVEYVSRPKAPGVPHHGKAGNLNFTLTTILYPDDVPPAADQLVVIFDCDMEARFGVRSTRDTDGDRPLPTLHTCGMVTRAVAPSLTDGDRVGQPWGGRAGHGPGRLRPQHRIGRKLTVSHAIRRCRPTATSWRTCCRTWRPTVRWPWCRRRSTSTTSRRQAISSTTTTCPSTR